LSALAVSDRRDGHADNDQSSGPAQTGPDPRRHQFTLEECRRGGMKGYEAAWQSLERRFPGCDPHFLLCAILGSRPWYTLPGIFAEEPSCE